MSKFNTVQFQGIMDYHREFIFVRNAIRRTDVQRHQLRNFKLAQDALSKEGFYN